MLGLTPVSSSPISDLGGFNGLVFPVGIPSAEAFGTVIVNPSILPTGIAGAQAFGVPSIGASVLSVGIPSGEAFGRPLLFELTPAEPDWIITNQRRIDWLLVDGTRIAETVQYTDTRVLPAAQHATDWVLVEHPNADIGDVSYLNPTVLSVLIH